MSNLKYRISAKHLKLLVRQPISRNIIGKTIFQIIIQIKSEMEEFIMVAQDVAKLTNSVKWHLKPQVQ